MGAGFRSRPEETGDCDCVLGGGEPLLGESMRGSFGGIGGSALSWEKVVCNDEIRFDAMANAASHNPEYCTTEKRDNDVKRFE